MADHGPRPCMRFWNAQLRNGWAHITWVNDWSCRDVRRGGEESVTCGVNGSQREGEGEGGGREGEVQVKFR